MDLGLGVLSQGLGNDGAKLARLRPCRAIGQANFIIGNGHATSVIVDQTVQSDSAAVAAHECVLQRIYHEVHHNIAMMPHGNGGLH